MLSSDFVNHLYEYKLIWTPLSPITMIYSGTAVILHNKYTLKETFIHFDLDIYIQSVSSLSFNGNLSLSLWAFSSIYTTIYINFQIPHITFRVTLVIWKVANLPEGGWVLRYIFAGYVLLASQNPYPSMVYSVTNKNIIDPILVTFGQICNFRDPNLVTFYFYELTHFLNWMKNTLLFTYSTNILVRLLTIIRRTVLPQKVRKCATPF